MQDRISQVDEKLLQRTAGPYIRVKPGKAQNEQNFSGLCRSPAIHTLSQQFDGMLQSVGGYRDTLAGF
jgi:hypothetical protein